MILLLTSVGLLMASDVAATAHVNDIALQQAAARQADQAEKTINPVAQPKLRPALDVQAASAQRAVQAAPSDPGTPRTVDVGKLFPK
jgi:hypothetical protein